VRSKGDSVSPRPRYFRYVPLYADFGLDLSPASYQVRREELAVACTRGRQGCWAAVDGVMGGRGLREGELDQGNLVKSEVPAGKAWTDSRKRQGS
jgi:hypothetical protein